MWLLNTHTGVLKYFASPDSPELGPKGYAVLSHCWGDPKDEQTFQATKALEVHDNPRDHATEKIKNFCILAESLGYDWGWADTCCIDKTSSSDLSEAINSMFRYYSMAQLCIVFLHDVPTGCDPKMEASEFRKSRWHKRGWTLQELIAPKEVVFYSRDWKKLSTKGEQAPLLEEITGIPKDVLTGKKAVTDVSVAARMSWAAYRETSKEEDEAYCLLGILKVDMYTSYGEGRHAFYRLQSSPSVSAGRSLPSRGSSSLSARTLSTNLVSLRTPMWMRTTRMLALGNRSSSLPCDMSMVNNAYFTDLGKACWRV